MTTNRAVLHKSKLGDFKHWLIDQGWQEQMPKSPAMEVLRMRHPDYNGVLLAYDRIAAKEHYTVYGISLEMYWKWQREIRIANT